MTYAQKLKSPQWQKKRLKILERDNWECTCCGDTKTTLHVHHIIYTGDPIKEPDENLITLCEHCHAMVEYYKDNDVEWMKKYFCTKGFLYIIKIRNGKTFFETLTNSGEIEEFAVFFPEVIEDLKNRL